METYAKLNVGQLITIIKIDAKFVSLTCLALLSKLRRPTIKYQMAEVRYLIFALLRELMQTPLVDIVKQKPAGISKGAQEQNLWAKSFP